jgi:hypothetical protein
VRRGEARLALRAPSVHRSGDAVVLDHAALQEVVHISFEELEQTFVFHALPGDTDTTEDLVVDIAVGSAWTPMVVGEALSFVHPSYGELRYGRAYAFDAGGARTEIAREWTGDGIRLTVPASFVDGATLPLTIDPPIGVYFHNGYGGPRRLRGRHRVRLLFQCVLVRVAGLHLEHGCRRLRDPPSPSRECRAPPVAIDQTTDFWAAPALAVSPGMQRLMVVASTTPGAPGTADANIEGRLVDTSNSTAATNQLLLEGLSGPCLRPDIGGNFWVGANVPVFCLVFEHAKTLIDHDIVGRVFRANGSSYTGTFSVPRRSRRTTSHPRSLAEHRRPDARR